MAMLTGRLEALAQQIKPGETMADIGTDHGFLPITLFTRGTCSKVIMTDVSENALAHARSNGEGILGLSEENYRAGDGLSTIKPGEVDVVVLAGMGGILMTSIMAADLTKAKSVSKFIFQPRNHPDELRRWIFSNGFSIQNECLVREKRKLCEIIVSTTSPSEQSLCDGNMASWAEDDIRWEIPPWYATLPDPLAKEYLHRKLERELHVRRELQKSQSPNLKRQTIIELRIDYLRKLCEKRESNDCL
jgi:tRNA (adenine22-N1)-methyltransferase